MISEKYAKVIRSLVHKKYRYKFNLFVAEGRKAIFDILHSGFQDVEHLFITSEALEENRDILIPWMGKVQLITTKEFTKISNLDSIPDMLMTGLIPPPMQLTASLLQQGIHLYLDQIQDPGNVGTILRASEWFGVKSIGFSEGCADIVHPKVVQASMGSFCRVKYWLGDLNEIVTISKMPILGAELDGKDLYADKLPPFGILVIGSEGQGISAINKNLLTRSIKIPSYGESTESLNAAVATSILIAEWQRQLHLK